MDSFRVFAGIVFAISVFFLFDAWMKEHQPPPTPRTTQPAPSQPNTTVPSAPGAKQAPPSAAVPTERPHGQRVVVTTDTLKAEIDTAGADLRRVELLNYRDTLDPQKNFVLLEDNAEHTYIAQSGVIGGPFPNHTSAYTVAETNYQLQSGKDSVVVRLAAADTSGARVAKTYTFRRGAYVVDIAFEVSNPQSTTIEPVVYFQLLRDAKPAPGDSKMVPTFLGTEVYTEKDKLRKASFEDIAKNKAEYPKDATDGWVAIVQHYFLGAWLPAAGMLREM